MFFRLGNRVRNKLAIKMIKMCQISSLKTYLHTNTGHKRYTYTSCSEMKLVMGAEYRIRLFCRLREFCRHIGCDAPM